MAASTAEPNQLANGDASPHVSTGRLPLPERVRSLLYAAHERFAGNEEGENAVGVGLVCLDNGTAVRQ